MTNRMSPWAVLALIAAAGMGVGGVPMAPPEPPRRRSWEDYEPRGSVPYGGRTYTPPPPTGLDAERIAKAQAKRERKAAKLRGVCP